MELTTIMSAVVALLVMAKKKTTKPVFGQMTLTGEKALDWVKDGVRVQCSKIHMGSPLCFEEWNIPEWGMNKAVIAVLFPIDRYQNPFLVTQRSILRVLEAQCVEWEEAGAAVNILQTTGGTLAEIIFEENQPTFEFVRPADSATYAPYRVVIE